MRRIRRSRPMRPARTLNQQSAARERSFWGLIHNGGLTDGFFRRSGAEIIGARTPHFVGCANGNRSIDWQADLEPDILPTTRLARWIAASPSGADDAIIKRLTGGLFSSIPIFAGGVINSIVVATVAAVRHPTPLFILWVLCEIILGISRLGVVITGYRALKSAKAPPITAAVLLSCAWASSVGFGAFISIASGDWMLAIIACVSAAGMVAGICLRNFGTPRLVAVMMVLCLLPCATAALLSGEVILIVITVQLPIYMATIGAAAFRLNEMLVSRMAARAALEESEALNRSILESSPDYTLLLDGFGRVIFCKRPLGRDGEAADILGSAWIDRLPSDCRNDAEQALLFARSGGIARLMVRSAEEDGRWFDIAVSAVSDGSGRMLVVARDITHQKQSEEQALWMAEHDPLTDLPNRLVLQRYLDRLLASPMSPRLALLVLDVDNFKLINDTVGHDAGDALLCAFAERLRRAVRPGDLVARLGGDEFAIVFEAASEVEVRKITDGIFAELHQAFAHEDRLFECDASIGACLYPRDGATRSDLMKAADIALYAAKAGGKGQLKIFQPSMRRTFQARNSMMYLARRALAANNVIPHYQPKVGLRSGKIVGFEALLRWRDSDGQLRSPDKLKAAFEDPTLAKALSDRMIDRTLGDIRSWLDRGIEFGHVAINVAAAEFRSGRFAEELLEKLKQRDISTHYLQIEVTETVFLGRGADHVQRALRRLRDAGLRIALDDFGTGFASLAHLMQFPVDALKIDKSFIKGIGNADQAEAITKAIVNLGHSLAIEIIAEGVQTPEQELYLINLGCQTGQGFLYSKAVAAVTVDAMLMPEMSKTA